MKLLVLGATGGVGREIVRQAIERGHQVTSLVRSPEGLSGFRNQTTVVCGDLLNIAEVGDALAGRDVVLSAFGPRLPISKSDSDLLQRFANVLTAAMQQNGIRRVIVVSVAFLFKDSIIPPAYLAGKLLFPKLVADAAAMEETFMKRGVDWTIVRPPELIDRPRNGTYRVREDHLPHFGFRISRANVAEFMLHSAENRGYIRKIVGVSN